MSLGYPYQCLVVLTQTTNCMLVCLGVVLGAAAGGLQFPVKGAHVLLNLLNLGHEPCFQQAICRRVSCWCSLSARVTKCRDYLVKTADLGLYVFTQTRVRALERVLVARVKRLHVAVDNLLDGQVVLLNLVKSLTCVLMDGVDGV